MEKVDKLLVNKMKLINTPLPYKDETLSSYLLRLSEANFYEDMSWITGLVGIKKRQLAKPNPQKVDLKQLAHLCNIDENDLWDLTFYKDILYFESKNEGVAFKEQANTEYDKICPECFSNEQYQRKIWNLKINMTCPFHNLLLINKCPQCQKSIVSVRRRIDSCNCGFNLLDLPKIYIEEEEAYHSKIVFNACYGSNIFPLNGTSPLDILDYYSLTRLINSFWYRLNNGRKGIGINQLNTQAIENFELLLKTFNIFLHWPYNFHEFLNKNNDVNTLNNIRRDLTTKLNVPELDFMKEGFISFFEQKKKKRVIFSRFDIKQNKLMSIGQVTRTLKTTLKAINNLVKNGVLEEVYDKNSVRSFTTQSVINFLEYKKRIVFKKDLAERLGLHYRLINEFEKHGFVKRIELFSQRNPTKSYYDICFADELIAKIEKNNSNIINIDHPTDEHINFANFHNRGAVKGISFIELVNLLIEGHFKIYRISSEKGFKNYYFKTEEVLGLFRKNIWKKFQNGMVKINLQELSKLMDININSVTSWYKKGFLSDKCIENHVSYVYLLEFTRKYVPLIYLARKFNTSTISLKEELEVKKILPITGREVDGGNGYLYKKELLSDLIMDDLVKNIIFERLQGNIGQL